MADTNTPTPAAIHTLATLCDELVSGRAVSVDDKGTTFQFVSPETRSLFNWYRINQAKWAGNVQKPDVEAMVDQMLKEPPSMPAIDAAAGTKPKRVVHLKTLTAHRFAGIHPFGSADAPPADFCFEFASPLTLVDGVNGAGKTSLLSAITWCLTGCVYRPQRPPETADQSVPVALATDGDLSDDAAVFTMAPITPMPPEGVLIALGEIDVPIDTWVELEFVDDAGNPVATVRRSLKRTPRGKIEVTAPDMSALGLAPVAREVGTKMPGLIPYIRLGEACDIGKAVSALTGLKPLEDLVKHAEKVQAKLERDLVKDRQAEIDLFDADFSRARQELTEIIAQHPDIDPKASIPIPSEDKGLEDVLAKHDEHFENLQAQALSASKKVLGEAFNPQDATARKDLTECIGPALGLIDPGHLKGLTSARRLAGLAVIDDGMLSLAEALLTKFTNQAEELSRLAQEPDTAARLRLYARVAGWMKDLPELLRDITECPICQTALGSRSDPITGKAIAEHLSHYLKTDSDYVEKTVGKWETSVLRELRAPLPEQLQAEMGRELPSKPAELIFQALTEELFESKFLKGSLLPLKSAAKSLCDKVLGDLPAFVEPGIVNLPDCFDKSPKGVNETMRRIRRAIAFSRWRKSNEAPCKAAFVSIVGQAPGDGKPSSCSTDQNTLYDRLAALDKTVKNAEPLTNALTKVAAMKDKLDRRRKQEARIALYAKAAKAIEPLFDLQTLVAKQVAFLVDTLSSKTAKWKEGFYSPAFVGAPEVVTTDVATDGSLRIEAVAGGAKASADHVSNASDLRATLLAFLLAFWEYLLDSRGGLSLLLLDDLQEFFDRHNRRRVANSIPLMLAAGGRLVITTNDHGFGRLVMTAMKKADSSSNVDHRCIHTLNPNRDHIELGHFSEEVDSKREVFERSENVNQHQPARDYVKDLRIYLEERLLDLFEIPQPGLPKQPTLSDLVGAVRSRINTGHEVFTSRAFQEFASDGAMRDGSQFLNIMNECHHGNEGSITYNDVVKVKDDCIRVRGLVDAAHVEYGLWLRRDPRDPPTSVPDAPQAMKFPSFDIPIVKGLAAFTSDVSAAEPLESEETLTHELLAGHAMYVVNSHNLGFAGRPHCRVIVSTKEIVIPGNSLVIALHGGKAYARRLLRNASIPGTIALGSDAENPLKRPPALFLPASEVRLLQVVGVLFDDSPSYPKQADEAWLVDGSESFQRTQVAFTVREDSAIPLALPNQTVLGGTSLTAAQVSGLEDRLVAIATTEGSALKRVGKAMPGFPHVRLLESIGGLGESMLVRLEDREDGLSDIPLMVSAREILGVLYTTAGTI